MTSPTSPLSSPTGDGTKGTATSAPFKIPPTVTLLTFMRAGGADAPSGVYVKIMEGGTVVCEDTNGADTDKFFKVNGL